MTPPLGPRRLLVIAVAVAVLALGATACEPRVTGQILFAGDFTATDSSPWVEEDISISSTGFLPTVNAVQAAGVRDTDYWVQRLDALDDHGGFDAVVLSLGTNDVAAGDLTPDLAGKIATIADAATAGGSRTAFWATLSESMPSRQAGAVAFNAALRAASASRPKLHLIEFGAELAAHPEYLATDQVHWSVTGQQAFASLVASAIGAVPPRASVAVTHRADEGSVTAGHAIHYHVVVTNTGPSTLHHVRVIAPQAPGCAGALPDLAPGAVQTIDCTYTTTPADVGVRQSTVYVTSDEATQATSETVDVTVRAPAATIAGTVTETGTGTPIGGARLIALRAADFSVAAATEAGTDGRYELPVGSGSYFLYVLDPALGHKEAFYGAPTALTVTAGTSTPADPSLAPVHGSVAGTVREVGGPPLSGVWALALGATGLTGEPEAATATAADGSYTLTGLRAGPHYLGFLDPTGAHATRFHPASPDVPGAGQLTVTGGATTAADGSLPAQPAAGTGATVTGTVTEQGTGTAIAGARVVALRAADFALVRAATADAGGHYRLDVPTGTYKLALFDPTGAHRMEWYDDRPSTGLPTATPVTAPGVADAALVPATGALAGRVTDDASGLAVPGAWVLAIGPNSLAGVGTAAADGTYRISGLAAGTYRVAVLDPTGAHLLEFFQDASGFGGATPVAVAGGATATVDVGLAAPRPNVVMILTDDQTLESMRVMPRVQALLADQGTTFANYFDTFPLCCPARATLLTGQYSHNHHVVNNIAVRTAPTAPIGGSGALDHTNTLVTWLHAAGYRNAHVGKYLNCWGNDSTSCRAGPPTVPPGWDDWYGLIDPYPANYGYFEFDVLDNGQVRHVGPGADIYQTDVLTDRAVADVHQLAGTDQPFFLNIWPQAPHAGGGSTAPTASSPAPSPAYTGMFTSEPAPSTPAVGEADVSDKPSYIRCGIGLTSGEGPGPNCTSPPTSTWTNTGLTAAYRATLQSLQSVDEMVEDVVRALDETGELDNTVIIYTSDNGYLFGEHRLNLRKVVPYEESIHVPLVVRGPGFPAGHVANQLVGNIDIAPTIAALTGATPQRVVDGRSLLPIAEDPTVATQRALLLEDWPVGTFVGIPPHYDGIRTATDVYLEWANGEREYYDLATDPYQLDSRHADPTTATRRTALAALLAQLKTCAGANCEVVAPP